MDEKFRVLSTVSFYHAITDGPLAVMSILFPIFKTVYSLTYTQVGIITGGGLFITLIAQLLIGRAADGKNTRSLLSLGVFLTSISLLFLAQSIDFYTLMIFIFFLRFSTSFFHPIGIGWISRIFKKNRLDWAMGIQSGAADICSFIAVATTLSLSQTLSIDFTLYLWAIIGVFGLFFGLSLTRRLDPHLLSIPQKKQRQTFRDAYSESIHFLKRIKRIIPAFMISGSAWGVIISYYPLLLQERTTIPLPMIGFIVAIWIGIGGTASIFYGRINTILGRRTVVIYSYFILGIMGILLTQFTHILILIMIMVCLGISVFLTYPALFSYVSEITHESVEGRTFGITFTLQTGGGALGLFLSGVISDLYGISVPFIILGVLSLLLTFSLLLYPNKPLVHPL
ncbi:MAG: MFS transporter [Methanobacteriota archaeon]